MGAWGPAIFSDDLAADVREEFRSYIGDGLTPEKATEALVAEYRDALGDAEEGPVFWLALAATQWSLGRLLPSVRDKALLVIDSGQDLARWQHDSSQLAKRRKALDALREQLNSDPPAPKKVPRRFRDTTEWGLGTIIAYRTTDGLLSLFRVIGHHQDKGGTSPIVELLDWRGDSLPSRWEVTWMKVRSDQARGQRVQIMLGRASAKELPVERIVVTGWRSRPSQRPGAYSVVLWRGLDAWLEDIFAGEGL